jgi:hypothetical protein
MLTWTLGIGNQSEWNAAAREAKCQVKAGGTGPNDQNGRMFHDDSEERSLWLNSLSSKEIGFPGRSFPHARRSTLRALTCWNIGSAHLAPKEKS